MLGQRSALPAFVCCPVLRPCCYPGCTGPLPQGHYPLLPPAPSALLQNQHALPCFTGGFKAGDNSDEGCTPEERHGECCCVGGGHHTRRLRLPSRPHFLLLIITLLLLLTLPLLTLPQGMKEKMKGLAKSLGIPNPGALNM